MSGFRHNPTVSGSQQHSNPCDYSDEVTKRLHRYYNTHDLHFITCSCFHRQPQLDTPERRDLFLSILEEARQKYCFVVHGYVVMPEHFHLLITEPEVGDPSVVMKVLKERFTKKLRAKRVEDEGAPLIAEGAPLIAPFAMSGIPRGTSRPEPPKIWQKRFYDFNVWTEQKHIEKLRYIHRNPVQRGLVENPSSGSGAVSEPISSEKLDRCARTFKSGRWKSRIVLPRVSAASETHSFAGGAPLLALFEKGPSFLPRGSITLVYGP